MIENQLPIHFFPSNHSILSYTQHKLKSVLKKHHDSFFIVNLSQLYKRLQLWAAVFPSITPYHNISKNFDRNLLNVMSHLDVGFQCSTKNDIESLPFTPLKIIFNAKCLMKSFVQDISHQFGMLVFQSISEYKKIRETAPNANLLLKFDISNIIIYESASIELEKLKMLVIELSHLIESDQNQTPLVTGVCVTSCETLPLTCNNLDIYEKAMDEIFELLKNVVDSIDLKGSSFSLYFDVPGFMQDADHQTLFTISNLLASKIEGFEREAGVKLELGAEISDFLLLNECTWSLASPIIALRSSHEHSCPMDNNLDSNYDNKNNKMVAFINNSVYDVFMNLETFGNNVEQPAINVSTIKVDHQPSDAVTREQSETHVTPPVSYDIFGHSGCAEDKLLSNVEFEDPLSDSDWLLFHHSLGSEKHMTTPAQLTWKYQPSIRTLYFAEEADRELMINMQQAFGQIKPCIDFLATEAVTSDKSFNQVYSKSSDLSKYKHFDDTSYVCNFGSEYYANSEEFCCDNDLLYDLDLCLDQLFQTSAALYHSPDDSSFYAQNTDSAQDLLALHYDILLFK